MIVTLNIQSTSTSEVLGFQDLLNPESLKHEVFSLVDVEGNGLACCFRNLSTEI